MRVIAWLIVGSLVVAVAVAVVFGSGDLLPYGAASSLAPSVHDGAP